MTIIDCLKILFREDDINPLSPEEMRVYITLLKEWNRQGRPDTFEYNLLPNLLPILSPKMSPNSSPKMSPNSSPKKSLLRTREKLQKRGLIQYVSGNGKVKNPCYKICGITNLVTKDVTNLVTKDVTNSKEKVSPTPPLKENISEFKEKERISKDIPKKETDLAFCLPSFVPIMEEWLEYKQKRKESYKTEASVRKCYQNLVKLSDNNAAIAQLIVDQSIANNWAGLFELKNHGTPNNTSQTQRTYSGGRTAQDKAAGRQSLEDLADAILGIN